MSEPETAYERFLRVIPDQPERARRLAAAHDERIAREGPPPPEPECINCGEPVHPGYRPVYMNSDNPTFWVHGGGFRWCHPDQPGQTTHADPGEGLR